MITLNSPAKIKAPKGDTAFYRDAKGNVSNAALHDEMMKGVSPARGEAYAKSRLKGVLTAEQIALLT